MSLIYWTSTRCSIMAANVVNYSWLLYQVQVYGGGKISVIRSTV